jgi:hypothetical protein
MSIYITIESEFGEKIDGIVDELNLLHMKTEVEDSPYEIIKYIDPYGNTVFNRYQIEPLLSDIEKLSEENKSTEALEFLTNLKDFAMRCLNEVHTYLKFYGD